jgi:hypothetical protein
MLTLLDVRSRDKVHLVLFLACWPRRLIKCSNTIILHCLLKESLDSSFLRGWMGSPVELGGGEGWGGEGGGGFAINYLDPTYLSRGEEGDGGSSFIIPKSNILDVSLQIYKSCA